MRLAAWHDVEPPDTFNCGEVNPQLSPPQLKLAIQIYSQMWADHPLC